MARSKEELNFCTPTKKLRFRGELNYPNRIENLDEETFRKNSGNVSSNGGNKQQQNEDNKGEVKGVKETPSFLDFFKVELNRGYMLEHDEERYTARRQKIYSFMRIPRDLERFMVYGLMQCADSFLYIHTFLPVRFVMAMWGLLTRPIASCLGLRRRTQRLLSPAEICDLLKCVIWLICTVLLLSVDTNRMYHIIKSQSTIKLYILYNMLEVGDRLLSAFGQDTIDALFWTATEPKHSKQKHSGLIAHIFVALIYVLLHTVLIMFQATSLNVAMNSNNKGLLTIMMSNNFVELKGSVFKKFDKNNLFQLACSDVRERFHLSVLLFIVMIQTMKEFDWSPMQFCVMLPDILIVLSTEIIIDWIKHAFITRFNELPECIYREYTTSLAYDMTQTRQKHAFSDHSDLVARRMGFIPFPLGVVLIKAVYSAVSFKDIGAWVVFTMAYIFLLCLRIAIMICALGKACKLMKDHQEEKNNSTPSSMTNQPTLNIPINSMAGVQPLIQTPRLQRYDAATSPRHPEPIIITSQRDESMFINSISSEGTTTTASTSTPKHSIKTINPNDIELDVKNSLELGATALFSNSDVDLDDVCLNEKVLHNTNVSTNLIDLELAHSEPDLSQQLSIDNEVDIVGDHRSNESDEDKELKASGNSSGVGNINSSIKGNALNKKPERNSLPKRTHKRSESEPGIQSIISEVNTNDS